MATASWHYIENSFLVATRTSYKKAYTVGYFTYRALQDAPLGDTILHGLKTYFSPIFEVYKQVYEAWSAAGGQEEGATLTLQQLEEVIDNEVNDWEYTILGVYKKGTPGYKVLFPDGITALKRGTRDQRINRLNTFSLNLALTSSLDTLKTTVDGRITDLQNATTTKGEKKRSQKLDSTQVEAQRVAMCIGLYHVLGGLITRYDSTPEAITAYFDLETLRDVPQTEFLGSVHAGEQKLIVQRKQDAGAEVRLINNGTTGLTFFFAPMPDTPFLPGMPCQPVAAGEDLTVLSAAAGATDSNVFLIVKNDSDVDEGHWRVVM